MTTIVHMDISRRPVKIDDFDEILRWRNSPETLLTTRDGKEINYEEHFSWSERRIREHESQPYFAYIFNHSFVAITRLDKIHDGLEISILVSPEWRKNGIAKYTLNDTLNYVSDKFPETKIIAWIKKDNYPSIKLFTSEYFIYETSHGNFLKYYWASNSH